MHTYIQHSAYYSKIIIIVIIIIIIIIIFTVVIIIIVISSSSREILLHGNFTAREDAPFPRSSLLPETVSQKETE